MSTRNRNRFRPHQFANDVQYLYHVYDNLSQTPYRQGRGIQSGDINCYLMHPQYIITDQAMANHLNWNNREPTYFISLYDNLDRAQLEANRRRSQVFVPNQVKRRDPGSVGIAKVSVYKLEMLKVFYFSREDLLEMLRPPRNHPVFTCSSPGEWFVMAYIPNSAIELV